MRAKLVTGAALIAVAVLLAGLTVYVTLGTDLLPSLWLYTPAWVLLIYWFVIQVVSGAVSPAEGGGVAFWAHAGGFVAGLALIIPFRRRVLVEAKRAHVQLDPRTIPRRGWF